MRLHILPYKMSSVTARNLARELGVLRLLPSGGRFTPKRSDLIVNWGLSVIPNNLQYQCNWLNHPTNVAITSNKRAFFDKYTCMPVPVESFMLPESTTNFSIAKQWVEQGHKVYCRTMLSGHSGRGIVVADNIESLVNAPLYTKGFKAKHEYRVHVFNGQIIDMIKKGRRRDHEWCDMNMDIRNHSNGFVFIRGNIDVPQEVRDASIAAVAFYGLHFGAVDVGWHPQTGACVYEINTAPGVAGTALAAYQDAIVNYISR